MFIKSSIITGNFPSPSPPPPSFSSALLPSQIPSQTSSPGVSIISFDNVYLEEVCVEEDVCSALVAVTIVNVVVVAVVPIRNRLKLMHQPICIHLQGVLWRTVDRALLFEYPVACMHIQIWSCGRSPLLMLLGVQRSL